MLAVVVGVNGELGEQYNFLPSRACALEVGECYVGIVELQARGEGFVGEEW